MAGEYALAVENFHVDYIIDITRDINAVGLIYFAAYFSIIDGALLQLWKHLGRSAQSFLERIVIDHRICYLRNAEIDSVLTIRMKLWRMIKEPGREVLNAVVLDRATGNVIAVSTACIVSKKFT